MRGLERRLVRLESRKVGPHLRPLVVLAVYDKPGEAVIGFAWGKGRVGRRPGEEVNDLAMRARRELRTNMLWAEYVEGSQNFEDHPCNRLAADGGCGTKTHRS